MSETINNLVTDPTKSETSKTNMLLGMILTFMLEHSGAGSKINMCQDIKDFHKKFNQEYGGPVRELNSELAEFRLKFLKEELEEFEQAYLDDDLEGQVDALFDLVYVALGTAYLMGIDFNAVWKEGHASNMSKTLVAKGEGKHGFTVLKGDNYFKPNFKQFIK